LPIEAEERFERNKLSSTERLAEPIPSENDSPLSIRSLSIDIARNFHSLAALKRIITQMGKIKMTHLLLHATDDEGWRIEIPGLEELTDLGAYRCVDHKDCLEPQYGSGPFKESDQNGYLTVDEYKQLLKHGMDNNVNIITEINGPGHARAAIKAMQKKNDPDYFLYDTNQENTIESVQYFTDNVLNPCMESTFTFLNTVITHLKEVHAEFGNFHKIIHMGGDEVPHRGDEVIWETSPICQQFIKTNSEKPENENAWKEAPVKFSQLFHYFAYRYVQILDSHGFAPASWEEPWTSVINGVKSVRPKEQFLPDPNKPIYAFNWNIFWDTDDPDWSYLLPNKYV